MIYKTVIALKPFLEQYFIEIIRKKIENYTNIDKSIQRGYAENSGTDLDSIIPPTSRRQGARERKKQEVLRKIQLLVETYSGI